MLLGCIGDDFTGSSDLANTLAKGGMTTVQYSGTPLQPAAANVEAGVIALKSRSIDPKDAIDQSIAALKWLRAQGCEQYFFKYCSTFDSTPDGNIGPVIDALADELDAHKIIVCPAFPGAGRSVYQGHLFVGDKLLSESGMEKHPLTPMTDPDIRRWLKLQTENTIGHIAAPAVLAGAAEISAALSAEQADGNRLIVVDALRDEDLRCIGAAAAGLPLVTGGSGIALGLPDNFAERLASKGQAAEWTGQPGKCAILSGSCSSATRAQIEFHRQNNPTFEIDAADVIEGRIIPEVLISWLTHTPGLPLAYSSADPAAVADVQDRFGREKAAEKLEKFFGDVAVGLVRSGISRLLTAGGETSGAVVEALEVDQLEIGPEIDPGVPALRVRPDLVIALKSGNFGAPDYFEKAAGVLAGEV
jgi:uncharacterized protein YgbK (DUF1537 family)